MQSNCEYFCLLHYYHPFQVSNEMCFKDPFNCPIWLASHKGYWLTIRHQSIPSNVSSSTFKCQRHLFVFWLVLLERVLMFIPFFVFQWWPTLTGFSWQWFATSGINAEREQFLWVHVIKRAQVRKFEEQLGESGGVARGALADEGSESPD